MKKKFVWAVVLVGALGAATFAGTEAAEKDVKLNDLPPAVQKAVTEHSAGGTIEGLEAETEDGATVYEAELLIDGRAKDVTFDAEGRVLVMEEETTLDRIPAAARDAIQKAVGNATVSKVEVVVENGKTLYEAEVKRFLRTSEVMVTETGERVE